MRIQISAQDQKERDRAVRGRAVSLGAGSLESIPVCPPERPGSGPPEIRLLRQRGFTLVELLLALAVIAALVAVAVPFYSENQKQAMISQAIGDVRALETEIDVFELQFDRLPNDLSEIDRADLVDPWGNPYEYLPFSDAKSQSQIRLDKNLKPINTTYDLYSVGEDGKSKPPLTAEPSRDDIVRASDGGFVGLGEEF